MVMTQEDIDRAIQEHEARVNKQGFFLVFFHDLLLIGIIYFVVKFI